MLEFYRSDIRKWVRALRSGKYNQGEFALQSAKGFCCLGVACKIFIPRDKLELTDPVFGTPRLSGFTPLNQSCAPKWLRMINNDFLSRTGIELSVLNDCGVNIHKAPTLGISPVLPLTFDEIADMLELVYIHGAL